MVDHINKSELIDQVADELKIERTKAKRIVDNFLKKIVDTVCADNKAVRLNGFAMFEPYVQPARKGRNPQTGEIVMRPETTVVKCRISDKFKEYAKTHHAI